MPTWTIHHYESIGSTNDEAKRLAALGAPEGTVVSADTQTAGRGRGGRNWITPPGEALAMSLVLRPTVAAPHTLQIALLGGLAVLEGVERVVPGLAARVKWPNDVLAGGKKVAGVLAEAAYNGERLEYIVLGIGVNVNAGPPPELALEYSATSLRAEAGRGVDRIAVRDSILAAFDDRYPQLGSPALAEAWQGRLAMRGQRVRVIGVTETIEGILEGVTAEGGLLIRLGSGELHPVLAGDVHLRGT